MTIEGQKPLEVGQVLEGLLEEVRSGAAETARAAEAGAEARASAAPPPVTLWERMLAAVDLKFDGDNDGDVRGKG